MRKRETNKSKGPKSAKTDKVEMLKFAELKLRRKIESPLAKIKVAVKKMRPFTEETLAKAN